MDYKSMISELERVGHGPFTKSAAPSQLPNRPVTWPLLEQAMILVLKPFRESIKELERKVSALEAKDARRS
jgi:hypothetical protein